ncbi:MAG: Holliday junction branch migration protein RuvA [Oscillospiraceae bacterium]|nr:Holliday junction branch migration protein RuvA [Oscillospiraceae bacterium]MDD6502989.1 Holliday junction branch migration protein RuvA [Oscillospiraceae bacterium]
MFNYLNGTVTELEPNLAVVECGGVGFSLNVSLNTLRDLKLGEKAKVYVDESIREDAFELFGFSTKSEKRCFELLTGVSGVGPKAAMAILSATTPDGLVAAVLNGNEKVITAAPGVGKKLAQRVLLELKDKVGKIDGIDTAAIPDLPPAAAVSGTDRNLSDAISGLLVLGYSQAEINGALKGVDTTGMTSEAIIKAVLRQMVK